MRIMNRIKVEDCFDGSSVFVYELSEPWTEERARGLAVLGSLQYFADFPRPFFSLRADSGLCLNGVSGAGDCRVVLPPTGREDARTRLEEVIGRVE